MNTNPLVSVVITTKNEERKIETCVKSILLQTYPKEKIEIILVDNNSTDKTKEIANKYTHKVYDKGPERSAQRNYGLLEKSSGVYLLYLDADMILSPSVIEQSVKTFINNGDIVALHIGEVVLGKKYFSKVRRFERGFYDGTVIDGARFFKKEALQKVNGFDENMTGPEDWDLDKKLKQIGKISLLDFKENIGENNNWILADFIKTTGVDYTKYGSVIFHDESEFDLRKYLFKKSYYAQSFHAYTTKWGLNDSDIIKQLGVYYRFCGVFIEDGKWKKVIKSPMLAIGMFSLRFLVGIVYLFNKK